jgi:hypothetical protein
MKQVSNFAKILVSVLMVLCISMFVACSKDDDNKGDDNNGNVTPGGNSTTPAALVGTWTKNVQAYGDIEITFSAGGKLTSTITGDDRDCKFDGNKITFSNFGYTFPNSVNFSVSGNTLTLSGFTSPFDTGFGPGFNGAWTKKGTTPPPSTDPLIGKWYGENDATFSVVIFEFKSGGKVVSSGMEMDYVYDASTGTLTLSMMGYTFNTYTNVTLNGGTLTITSDDKTDTLKKH